jgi:hypothetical protein
VPQSEFPDPRSRTVFDSSTTIASVAARGFGVALLPAAMFQDENRQQRLIRPFKIEVTLGDDWITPLRSLRPSPAMLAFKSWLLETIAVPDAERTGHEAVPHPEVTCLRKLHAVFAGRHLRSPSSALLRNNSRH